MPITLCGLSHRTAPLKIREQFALSSESLAKTLPDLQQSLGAKEVTVLSTCNRFEVLGAGLSQEKLHHWLMQHFSTSLETLEGSFYYYHSEKVVEHLLRVACGIDSLIIGEPQILGQLKIAYRQGREVGTVGKQLSHLLNFTFSAAKKIRHHTGINQSPVSAAYAAISLAKKMWGELQNARVLLVGAGSTSELIARYLFDHQVSQLIVASRTLQKTAQFSEEFHAKSITIGEIPDYLSEIDLVFSSTASQLPIIGKGLVERVLKHSPGKKLLMMDLAVPRDIEPEVAELPGVQLYNIDDLGKILEKNHQDRLLAAEKAEAMIAWEVQRFKSQQSARKAVPLIQDYRQKIETAQKKLVSLYLKKVERGTLSPQEALHQLGRQLSNQFMHEPLSALRKAASQEEAETLKWAKKFLGLGS